MSVIANTSCYRRLIIEPFHPPSTGIGSAWWLSTSAFALTFSLAHLSHIVLPEILSLDWHVMQGFQFDDQELSAPFGELGASTFPSPSQEAAVLDLLDFKDEKILAWLTLLRSLQQGYQHLSSSQVLSSRQIDALSLMKDSPDALVLQWLRTRRYTGRWWLQNFSESIELI